MVDCFRRTLSHDNEPGGYVHGFDEVEAQGAQHRQFEGEHRQRRFIGPRPAVFLPFARPVRPSPVFDHVYAAGSKKGNTASKAAFVSS